MKLELTPELAEILFDALDDAEYYRAIEEDDEDRDDTDTEILARYALLREAIDEQQAREASA